MTTPARNLTLISDEQRAEFWAYCLRFAESRYPELEGIRAGRQAEESYLKPLASLRAANPEFSINPLFQRQFGGVAADLFEAFTMRLPGSGLAEEQRLLAALCKVGDRICYGRKLAMESACIWFLLAFSEALTLPDPTAAQLLDAAMRSGIEPRHEADELDAEGEYCPYEKALGKWGRRFTRNGKEYRAYSHDEEQSKRMAKGGTGAPRPSREMTESARRALDLVTPKPTESARRTPGLEPITSKD